MSTRPASLLIGPSLQTAEGRQVICDRSPSSLLEVLSSEPAEDRPDAWMILGRFEGNRRARDPWRGSSGFMLDLDYEDPAVPRDEGAHQAIPEPLRSAVAAALAEFSFPGLAYLTPRGLRWAAVFESDVEDLGMYGEVVQGAAARLLDHLSAHGIPLWRDGVTGFRFDSSSARPEQPMRLPLAGVPIIRTGGDWPIWPTDFLGEDVPRMDLDAALPPDIADVVRQIARWVQIAPEVVVTGLMALVSAAIGNTRWVVVRGFAVPVSLQYLTILLSGSGKSTVRSYLRGALVGIQAKIQEQRNRAAQELNEYAARLEAWRTDRRSAAKRASAGPRPEPPKPSSRGGLRATFMVSEATLEGIIATLEDSPRGVLWASDEAHEVLGLLGRYGDGAGARSLDAARLRRLMQSEPVEAHRAKGNQSALRRIPRPWLALDADVQPGVFENLFSQEDRVSGMTSRFLAHAPPSMQGRRQYVDPPPRPGPEVLDLIKKRVEALWDVDLELRDGVPWYRPLTVDPEAERLWAEELERLERRYPGAGDEEAGMLGHARGRMLRLSGALCLLADTGAGSVGPVDMTRAIHLMRYHLAQDRMLARRAEAADDRLEQLRQRAEKIFKKQSEIGVRPSDLRNNVSKTRYGGTRGQRQALVDLHALGWELLRPRAEEGRPGRKPVPAFFPPHAQKTSAKSAKPQGRGGLADMADRNRGSGPGDSEDASELIQEAGLRLLESGEVRYPRSGTRGPCPACGSPDGLGVLPESPTRWYCHSDRHVGQKWGGAVDYMLARGRGGMPSAQEAVREAKRTLGLDGEGPPRRPRPADTTAPNDPGETTASGPDPAEARERAEAAFFGDLDPVNPWDDPGGRP